MSQKNIPLFFLVTFLLCAAARAQIYEGVELVRPALIADTTAILPGQKFTVGLHLIMAPGWHTYWQYPGDSGLAPKIEWDLPPGFSAGPIQWPLPEKLLEPGDILTYGYKSEVLLLVEISAPAQITEQEVTLKAKASWLVCEQICIPGSAPVSLTLPVANASAAANRRLFEKYRGLLPKVGLPTPFAYKWNSEPGVAVLEIATGKSDKLEFFPLPPAGSIIEHPKIGGGEIRIPVTTGAPDQLSGVVVLGEGRERAGWFIASESSSAPAGSKGIASVFKLKGATRALFRNLLFGFIGGFILNLMPCVLPVIALKIFGFIQQAGQAPAKIFRLGLAFIAGIFVWFLGLAALVVGFKAAGRELNWAFQFQSPWFLVVMAVIVLVFALNLLGVFEVLLPAGANARLLDLVSHEGYRGAFLHGMFATLLATPCTAPFLGPALGFAFAQPPALVFAMFASIAAGMSLPYFLLTARPEWLRLLPKPGMWMVRVKQAMGVLLLGTVVWLVWILMQQHGPAREPFLPQLDAALRKGKTVFVDFTADWCVNCKVNERLVLDSTTVQEAFKAQDVIFLKADWTNGDSKITALLREFGRAGVPLYVIYPAGAVDAPIVLPELITPQIVLEGLERAAKAAR